MKYWAYLLAKLAVAGWIVREVWVFINVVVPPPPTFNYRHPNKFTEDLPWALITFGVALFAVGLLYLIYLDQRTRCRVCLRRLRMPVNEGSWSYVMLRPPRTASICPYGHGTLEEPGVHMETTEPMKWKKHGDIWEELEKQEDMEGRRR
jgi:hypothetical protein